ncbi:MAG: hypothetical protein AAFY98_00510 [Verrucomicrobiota bacterium]
MIDWMTEKEYATVKEMVGAMSLSKCPDPQAFERANYLRTLEGWTF